MNGVEIRSKTITIDPTFDASKFSTAIYEDNQEVTNINDINQSSCNLTFKLLYNKIVFSIQPTSGIV
ncbi:hypothetical protein IKS57_05655 [bacterium]|nr:hypothetical protein [bacterium]